MKYFYYFLIAVAIIYLQTILPAFTIYGTILAPDIILLFLTYVAIIEGRLSAILFGFILGLFQDLSTQINILGIYSFNKSISGFTLGTLNKFDENWQKMLKVLFIFVCYILHFAIYFYVSLNPKGMILIIGFKLTIIHSLINLIILLIFDKIIFNRII